MTKWKPAEINNMSIIYSFGQHRLHCFSLNYRYTYHVDLNIPYIRIIVCSNNLNLYRFLPTTYLVPWKVMFSRVSILMFRGPWAQVVHGLWERGVRSGGKVVHDPGRSDHGVKWSMGLGDFGQGSQMVHGMGCGEGQVRWSIDPGSMVWGIRSGGPWSRVDPSSSLSIIRVTLTDAIPITN